jgi:hypothetical protein
MALMGIIFRPPLSEADFNSIIVSASVAVPTSTRIGTTE